MRETHRFDIDDDKVGHFSIWMTDLFKLLSLTDEYPELLAQDILGLRPHSILLNDLLSRLYYVAGRCPLRAAPERQAESLAPNIFDAMTKSRDKHATIAVVCSP